MLRDRLKDFQYFEKRITINKDALERAYARESLVKPEYKSRWVMNIQYYNMEVFYLGYSIGDPVEELYPYFRTALNCFKDRVNENTGLYALMDYFSLAVLYSDRKEDFLEDLKVIYDKMPYTDGALDCFASYLFYGDVDPFHSTFEYLNMIGDDVESVRKAQGFWYYDHSDADWYNSHLRESYDGYWSWDTAALCKIRGILSPELKELDYFPYDLLVQG